jgi:hypothetical protein
MPRTYSPAQTAYLIARAAYEVSRNEAAACDAAYDDLCDANESSMTAADYAAWRLAQRDAPSNPILVDHSRAFDVLRAAERALIDWTLALVAPLATRLDQREYLETIRTVKPWQVKAYDGVISIAMRLDA